MPETADERLKRLQGGQPEPVRAEPAGESATDRLGRLEGAGAPAAAVAPEVAAAPEVPYSERPEYRFRDEFYAGRPIQLDSQNRLPDGTPFEEYAAGVDQEIGQALWEGFQERIASSLVDRFYYDEEGNPQRWTQHPDNADWEQLRADEIQEYVKGYADMVRTLGGRGSGIISQRGLGDEVETVREGYYAAAALAAGMPFDRGALFRGLEANRYLRETLDVETQAQYGLTLDEYDMMPRQQRDQIITATRRQQAGEFLGINYYDWAAFTRVLGAGVRGATADYIDPNEIGAAAGNAFADVFDVGESDASQDLAVFVEGLQQMPDGMGNVLRMSDSGLHLGGALSPIGRVATGVGRASRALGHFSRGQAATRLGLVGAEAGRGAQLMSKAAQSAITLGIYSALAAPPRVGMDGEVKPYFQALWESVSTPEGLQGRAVGGASGAAFGLLAGPTAAGMRGMLARASPDVREALAEAFAFAVTDYAIQSGHLSMETGEWQAAPITFENLAGSFIFGGIMGLQKGRSEIIQEAQARSRSVGVEPSPKRFFEGAQRYAERIEGEAKAGLKLQRVAKKAQERAAPIVIEREMQTPLPYDVSRVPPAERAGAYERGVEEYRATTKQQSPAAIADAVRERLQDPGKGADVEATRGFLAEALREHPQEVQPVYWKHNAEAVREVEGYGLLPEVHERTLFNRERYDEVVDRAGREGPPQELVGRLGDFVTGELAQQFSEGTLRLPVVIDRSAGRGEMRLVDQAGDPSGRPADAVLVIGPEAGPHTLIHEAIHAERAARGRPMEAEAAEPSAYLGQNMVDRMWRENIKRMVERGEPVPPEILEVAGLQPRIGPREEPAARQQPWEQTSGEYVGRAAARSRLDERSMGREYLRRRHRGEVEQALERGDPVPDAVVAEYPRLKARYRPTTDAQAERAGAKPYEEWVEGKEGPEASRAEYERDVEYARTRTEAEVEAEQRSGTPRRIPVEDLRVDPERFQYKAEVDPETGAGRALADVDVYDPLKAGTLIVWEAKDGTRYVADGHHRLDLARRARRILDPGASAPREGEVSDVSAFVLREKDGVSAEQARAIAAATNISQGRGTAIDAAKLIRDLDWTEGDFQEAGIPMRQGMARTAMGLSRLADPAFFRVVNGEIEPARAAEVGRYLGDEPLGKQMEALRLVEQAANVEEASVIARRIKNAPEFTERQEGLFGEEVETRSNLAERAKVETAVRRALRADRGGFAALVRNRARAQRVGAEVDVGKAEAESARARDLLDTLDRLADQRGAVSEILDEAAGQLARGVSIREASDYALRSLAEVDWRTNERVPADRAAPPDVETPGLFERGGAPVRPAGEIVAEARSRPERALALVEEAARIRSPLQREAVLAELQDLGASGKRLAELRAQARQEGLEQARVLYQDSAEAPDLIPRGPEPERGPEPRGRGAKARQEYERLGARTEKQTGWRGRPTGQDQVIGAIEDAAAAPIFYGRTGGKRISFSSHDQVARIQHAGSLVGAGEALGMSYMPLLNRAARQAGVWEPIAQELRQGSERLYGDAAPADGPEYAGMGDFTWLWLRNPARAQAEYPRTYEFWEAMLGTQPSLRKRMLRARQGVQDYVNQGAELRTEANVEWEDMNYVQRWQARRRNFNRWRRQKFFVQTIDDLWPIYQFSEEAEIKRGRAAPADNDPAQLAKALKGTEDGVAQDWYRRGVWDPVNPMGPTRSPSLREVAQLVDQEPGGRRKFVAYLLARRALERWDAKSSRAGAIESTEAVEAFFASGGDQTVAESFAREQFGEGQYVVREGGRPRYLLYPDGSIVEPTPRELKETIKSLREAEEQGTFDFRRDPTVVGELQVFHRGKDPGMSPADAAYLVERYQSERFDRAADKWYQFWRQLLEYRYEMGTLTEAEYTRIVNESTDYAPLQRVVENRFSQSHVESARLGSAQDVRRMEGSWRRVRDPFVSGLEQLRATARHMNQTRVVQALYETAQEVPGMGRFFHEVPISKQKVVASVDQARSQLNKMGVDTSGLRGDELLELWMQRRRSPVEDNIYSFRTKEGERKWVYVDPGLFEAVMGMGPYQSPGVVGRFFQAWARMWKTGTTGIRPGFAFFTNPTRDVQTFMGTGRRYEGESSAEAAAKKGVAYWKAAMDAVRDYMPGLQPSEMHLALRRLGVDSSAVLGPERQATARFVGRETRQPGIGRVISSPGDFVDFIREKFQTPELIPRQAAFERELASRGVRDVRQATWEDLIAAMVAAREVTVDFGKRGSVTGEWDRYVPFLNAQIQGPRAFYRALKRDPRHVASVGAAMALASLLNWNAIKDDEDYRSMRWSEKFRYNYLRAGDELLAFPVSPEMSMFTVAPTMMAEAMYSQDPRAFYEGLGFMLENMVPGSEVPWMATGGFGLDKPDPVRAMLNAPMPLPISSALQAARNRRTFTDAPIVPRGQKDMSPENQFGPFTSRIAVRLGQATGTSPRLIDFWVGEVFGGLGRDAMRLGGTGEEASEFSPRNIPVVGRMFVPDMMRWQEVEDLYERYDEAITRQADGTETEQEAEQRRMIGDAVRAIWIVEQLGRQKFSRRERNEASREARGWAREALQNVDTLTPTTRDAWRRRRQILEDVRGQQEGGR